MMKVLQSWQFMLAFVLIFSAAMVGMVIYGVTQHSEPGLFAEPWERSAMPLEVCARGYVSGYDELARERTQDAIGVMNERLAFEAFYLTSAPTHAAECDVVIVINAPIEPGWLDPGGDALVEPGLCNVRTAGTGTLEMTHLVLQHELGHCLGLAHDDWVGSIMRRTQVETPLNEFPPRITDSDRELLRDRYAPDPVR